MEIFLNSFGSYLHVENKLFAVNTQDGKQLIEPSKVKAIHISKGAKISSEAVLLAIEHEVDVLFLTAVGEPKGRIWSIKYGSISTIRKNQIDFAYSTKAVDWIKEVVIQKLKNQMALLMSFYPVEQKAKLTQTLNALKDYMLKVSNLEGQTVYDISASLRGWEGIASRRYFEALAAILPEPYKFKERSQRGANDMFNSLLNYGYGILYGKIEGALIKAGIDPYVGIFHRENYNRPVLVFDIIELFRVWIDYVVVDLCMQNAVSEDWFNVDNQGIYWLEGLGKRILVQSINDYMNEIIKIDQKERSRNTHIQQYAYDLARMFEQFNS